MADAHAGHGLETPPWLRRLLIGAAVLVMGLLVVLPLLMVLLSAFGKGFATWWNALTTPDAIAALKLTLFTAAIVIPVNAVFGVFAAWSLTRFEFRGKRALLALVDLPFAVSPVVAGLCLVLLFGSQGWFADFLREHQVKILFARPGIVLATLFITFPFVVRELVPLMQQQGSEEEVVARSLGANAWTMFFRVTLPLIRPALAVAVIFRLLDALRMFDLAYVLTGASEGTMTLSVHAREQLVSFQDVGYGSAASTALFCVIVLVTALYVAFLKPLGRER